MANSVPLKAIQEWLGHSDFAITANIYAHLEFESKVASANAMSWIEDTALAEKMNIEGVEKPVTAGVSRVSGKHSRQTSQKSGENRNNFVGE